MSWKWLAVSNNYLTKDWWSLVGARWFALALVKSNSESDRGEQMKSVVRVDVLRCTKHHRPKQLKISRTKYHLESDLEELFQQSTSWGGDLQILPHDLTLLVLIVSRTTCLFLWTRTQTSRKVIRSWGVSLHALCSSGTPSAWDDFGQMSVHSQPYKNKPHEPKCKPTPFGT